MVYLFGCKRTMIVYGAFLAINIALGLSTSDDPSNKFSFDVKPDGSYSLAVDNNVWLNSGPTWFVGDGQKFSTSNKTLKLSQITYDYGVDNIGPWNSTVFHYIGGKYKFLATFGQYKNLPLVFFGQSYLQDTQGTSVNNVREVSSSFPSFTIPNPASNKRTKSSFNDVFKEGTEAGDDLGYYAIKGYMAGDDAKAFGRFNTKEFNLTDGHHIGPIALFDKSGSTLILSPFINFMASSKWVDTKSGVLDYGFLGPAKMIPDGTEMWTMAYYNDGGITQAFEKWGSYMQTFYDAKNKEYAATDFTANYLGYWTDDGGYYYYNTEKNKTYEQTLLEVKQYGDQLKIPYRYIQLDSWFYPKYPMAFNGGIVRWIPYGEYFPHGLQNFTNKAGLFLSTHSKWWSRKTPLAKQNGGPYDFFLDKTMALPTDSKFWMETLSAARKWGTVMYEQDWLAQMFDRMSVLQENVTIGRQYMLQMGEALKRTGMYYQQGTSYPRHVLIGLEIPPLTQQRVTMDYGSASYNWRIGISSLWVYSLGQLIFKDVFWTTPVQNCPKYPGKTRPYFVMDSLVASLAAGPVGPGDGIGKTNRTLLMRCCTEDGFILKPDKPATSIDAQFYENAYKTGEGPRGEVWSTYTKISGLFFGIIFAADMNNSYTAHPADFGFPDKNVFLYSPASDPTPFSSSAPVTLDTKCTMLNYCVYYTTQKLQIGDRDVYLLGEMSKWIPFSRGRIETIEPRSADLLVTLKGAIHEDVYFTAVVDGTRHTMTCNLGYGGRAVLSIQSQTCLPV